MIGWIIAGAAGAAAAYSAPAAVRRYLRSARDDHNKRPALWNRFYALDWGETTTNNYGYAPAEGDDPQRFQHQMYRQMLALLQARRPLDRPLKLLEVSCGRGGGLRAFLAAAPGNIEATGLDVADSAIAFCQKAHADVGGLQFVQGSAMELPFPDASFDVVLNVEASNDYPDRSQFFSEVARVLKADGVFLYTDSFRAERVEKMKQDLAAAGFKAEFTDVTANVADACSEDSPRRRRLIQQRAPLLAKLLLKKQLANYAGIEGSSKHRAFVERRRLYLMTAAVKA